MEQSTAQMPHATARDLGGHAAGTGWLMKSSHAHTVVRLEDLLSSAESGFACGKSKLVTDGLPHLRPFNIGRSLQLELSEQYLVPRTEAPASKCELLPGDILFNNTNSVELVGKTAFVTSRMTAGFSNHLTRLRVAQGQAEPEFVAHYLNYLWLKGWFSFRCVQWVSQAAFNTTAIKAIEIPLPPLDEQRRIVDILNHAASIRRLREEARAKAREIIPALFVEMFGDPATNPKGWPEANVGGVTDVQGGLQLTKKRDALPLEMPYLRVANIRRNLLVLDEIKTIRVTEAEKARVRLHDGDLLIVEGHGNPQEIGRVAVWDGSISECLHQNHLIRARCRKGIIAPAFLCAFLNSETGRQQLLRQSKTTSGLNTISTSNVKCARVILPPLPLQQEFAERVAEVESITAFNTRAATTAEQMAQSLLAQMFGQVA